MRIAEDARLSGKNRIEEIKNYTRLSGIKRIGIAHCILFKKEAAKLREALEGEFEVYSIDCYNSRIFISELLGLAAMNLFNLHVVKTFSGTIAIYLIAIGGTHPCLTASPVAYPLLKLMKQFQ